MMRDDPRAWPSYMGLSDLYKTMGRMRDAIAMWRAADSVTGDSSDAAHLPIAPSEAEAGRWFADQARTWLDTVKRDAPAGEWVGPTAFAYAYASLRDTTETLHWFDSMLVHRDPAFRPSHWIRNSISCGTIRATGHGRRSCRGVRARPR